jgi:predicted nucleotidyltransferase
MNNSQFGFKEGDLEIIAAVLVKFPDIEKCIIYGSRAKGNHQQGSNVDIAIVSQDKTTAPEISSLLNEESPLPYTFDVIDYNTITHHDLTIQINRTGIVIYDRNSSLIHH